MENMFFLIQIAAVIAVILNQKHRNNLLKIYLESEQNPISTKKRPKMTTCVQIERIVLF